MSTHNVRISLEYDHEEEVAFVEVCTYGLWELMRFPYELGGQAAAVAAAKAWVDRNWPLLRLRDLT